MYPVLSFRPLGPSRKTRARERKDWSERPQHECTAPLGVGGAVPDVVVLEFCGQPVAFTREQLEEARTRARGLLPARQEPAGATTAELVDAEALAALTSLPQSWLEDQARRGSLPSLQLGKYRRFEVAAVIPALRKLGRTP